MRNANYWKKWFYAAGIRAIKTFFQVFGSLMTVGAAMNEIKWGYVASCSLVSGIYSIVTSLAGLPEVSADEEQEEDMGEETDGED
jgi:hypothetical protein